MSAFVFRLFVLLLSSGTATAEPRDAQVGPSCGVGPSTFLTDSGIGKLRIGTSRAAIVRSCRVIADTVVANDDYVETERILVIDLGHDTVRAALGVDTTITRIDIVRSRFRTRDGLRVGTTLRSLVNRRGLSAGIGEANVKASVPEHCGLAMVLSGKGGGAQGDEFTRDQLARWPPTIRVVKVEIHGCRDRNGKAS